MPGAIDKGIWSGETALLGYDGSEIPASQVIMSHKDSKGRLLYLSTIIRDISEIKCAQQERIALETRLRQAQKMESIGTLAGGIAHDFNNILGAILGYTEITLQELSSESPHRQNLEKVLQVADTGHGMNTEIKERIFDPFFTTKSKGEGTGLGLSVVHGIITSSGGAINVESAPGQGTTFSIYLPSIEDHGNEFKPAEMSLPTGTESILFVDDEAYQADLGQRMLNKLGYRVRSVTSSQKALELFLQSPHAYDLLITDMTMPQMTGDVLAGRIRQRNPNLPVIICTGFSNRMDEISAMASGIAAFLKKPILMKELAAAVRKALDEKRHDEPGTTPCVNGDSVFP